MLIKGTADRRLVQFITCKNGRKVFQTKGGYFCVLLLSLLPMAYPRPKQVRHKPSTEINPSIVNIHSALLSQIPASRFLCNRRVTVPPQKDQPPTVMAAPIWIYYQKKPDATRYSGFFLFSFSTYNSSDNRAFFNSPFRHSIYHSNASSSSLLSRSISSFTASSAGLFSKST